ncbi:malonic semialdehyde reductase [Rickettsia endosymbiont of Cardiosporidium cionae]|uniref:malonic semialdehyde reductase n=1 Tax=Rickettsia endosymbiont of Cardiosporidium cionae TaxID=2777155 RepID=UPI0018950D52|nr:malonic semialdehyde reductase [Rickettsia endosymbiont of Cardiosporidium cionae]
MRNIEEVFYSNTCYNFSDEPLENSVLKKIYNIMKYGPTSGNSSPFRVFFIVSKEAKSKLITCVSKGNIEKINSAPVTAIFAYDTEFTENMDYLNPNNSFLQSYFKSSKVITLDTAIRNTVLQSAYFMIVAKSLGVDCGPLSGFNHNKVNELFLGDTSYKSELLCNLGYSTYSKTHKISKLPRLSFEQCCKYI